MAAAASFPLISLVHDVRIGSFSDMCDFLRGSKGQMTDKDAWGSVFPIVVKGKNQVSFEVAIETIQQLVKQGEHLYKLGGMLAASYPWHLSEGEIDAAFTAIGELRRCLDEAENRRLCCWCLQCLLPPASGFDGERGKLRRLESKLRPVKEVYQHINASCQRSEIHRDQTLYLRPIETRLERAVSFNATRIMIHFNKKKEGDVPIGAGANKRITAAFELGTRTVYASAGYRRINLCELDNLRAFQHRDGFVQMVDSSVYRRRGSDKYRVAFAYCNRRDLYRELPELTAAERKTIYLQLIWNIAFMHGKGYLHRDLKSANIFLHQEMGLPVQAVIGDFGAVCKQNEEQEKRDHCTTLTASSPEYAAALLSPAEEQQERLARATTVALDSWSLGLILYDLLKMEGFPKRLQYQHFGDKYFGAIDQKIQDTYMERFGRQPLDTPSERRRYQAVRKELRRAARRSMDREYTEALAALSGNWLPEPPNRRSPQHLVWEMLQVDPRKRLLVTEAANRLQGLDWPDFPS